MDPTQIPLFDLADRRLAWIEQRETALSENIANADTPKWQPRDMPSFAATLGQQQGLAMARTDERHLSGTLAPPLVVRARRAGETAPDGNGVSIEDQMVKLADTDSAHALTIDLYHKYLGMFSTVLGH